jgi:apolipoprotein N-acyltransferase
LTRRVFLPLLSGVLFSLSFAPFHPVLRFCILFAFVPYLLMVLTLKRRVFLFGFIFGFIANGGILWWIAAMIVEGVSRALIASGLVLLLLYLSLYWGVVAVLVRRIENRPLAIWAFPFFWVACEFLRSLTSQLGFPWGTVGYAFARIPAMLQLASVTGIHGVSFSILLCNSLIFMALSQKHWRRTLLYLLIFLILLGTQATIGGMVVSGARYGSMIKCSCIQANILPEVKRAHEVEERIAVLEGLTLTAATRQTDLIIWSETSVPCYWREDSDCINRIKDIARSAGVPVVAGAPEYVPIPGRKGRARYNSAFLISGDGETMGRYRKIYLVPFGEHIPFDNTFPALRKVNLGQGDYSPGDSFSVLSTGEFSLSALICFEAIFPRLVRKIVRNGAGLLVNITEDSWYGRTSGPYQHAEMAIVRAVENRISIARCANSGISMLVDPHGRVLRSSSLYIEAIVEGFVPLRETTSFYTRWGDIFAWMVVLIAFLLFLFPFISRFRK